MVTEVDIVIEGGMLITMNERRQIISAGSVAIQGNSIVAVGKGDQLAEKYKGIRKLDARGKLILPGLIDGHNHTTHFLTKGVVDVGEPGKRLYNVIFPLEAEMSPQDVYVGSLGNFIEMIKSGTTCFVCPDGHHVDEIVRAAKEVGIRGIVSRTTWDFFEPPLTIPEKIKESTEEAIARGEELVKRWHQAENDRIRAWFSLYSPLNCSDRLCQEIKLLADKYQVGIQSHVSDSPFAREMMQKRWGSRSISRYHRLGLMAPNLYLVHMGWVTEEEVELVGRHGVKVCHCPTASMFGGAGNISKGMIPKMIEAGVTMSLGSDAAAISRFLDMVRVMYGFVSGNREMGGDRNKIDAYKALEMATIEGARALMWDDGIGSIAPGKRADLILVETKGPEWYPNPLANPIANFIYSAAGHSVEAVIIDGKVVMEDRELVTVDEKEVLAETSAAAMRLLDRAGIHLPTRWL